MKKILEQQTEVQGTKKFGNIKGVEALSVKELKETEGGWVQIGLAVAGGLYLAGYAIGKAMAHYEKNK